MANTIIYREEWKTKLQEKLEEPKYFMELAKVEYTSTKVMHNPYRNDSTATAYTRGSAYAFNDVILTDETVDIDVSFISPEFIDRADLAQAGFDMQMEMAERQADALLDTIETAFLAEHVNAGQSIDDGDLAVATNGGAGNSIILSSANVLEMMAKARQKIVEGKGLREFNRMGASVVLSPAQYTQLVSAARTVGVLDNATVAFEDGVVPKVNGFMVFESNLVDSTTDAGTTHGLAFVNDSIHIGILNTTFGDIVVDEKDPALQSGISVVSRVDFKTKIWSQKAPLVVDLNIVT